MRIWTLHPQYLDAKGLVALWRETLLARHVLLGLTKGYKNHPQLNRFKATENPVVYIDAYLQAVFHEATQRGYRFNQSKFHPVHEPLVLSVTTGQVEYEWEHLQRKLQTRDEERFILQQCIKKPELHPLFQAIDGGIESWEVIV